MTQKTYQDLVRYRKENHLKLKDLAYILNIDETNLSRFETGQRLNPKATLGYILLFNMSIREVFRQGFKEDVDSLLTRSFQLLERIEHSEKSNRIKGVNNIITRLSAIIENESGE